MELSFCSNCVLDGSAPDMVLDDKGVCNFCHDAQRELKMAEKEKPNLDKKIEQIKKDGKGKDYDCLLGLSGGVDSSTTLHHLIKLGLRPLCFSVDNGWQDPRADENIMRMVEYLKVPFYRYTIDLDKFRELQSAFIKAGLVNIEIPTDHVIFATTYELAVKYNIKWIISGGNVSEEGVMPPSWSFSARDLVHIKDVYKKMTGKRLKCLPLLRLWRWNYYRWVRKVRVFYLLDYQKIMYKSSDAKKMLSELYGWQDYGLKHEESIFTKWYQNFYLYTKFGIDKRKAHYSSLINSGQMTRQKAKELLGERPVYPMLGIEEQVMKHPRRRHEEFKMDWVFPMISGIIRRLRKLKETYYEKR